MKKNRNTFFSEAQFSNQSFIPNPNMNMMSANAPYQAAQASQSFYAGPNMPMYNNNINYDYNQFTEIENRIAKIERQLNRLDSRISKLESQTFYSTDNYDSNNSGGMYMV